MNREWEGEWIGRGCSLKASRASLCAGQICLAACVPNMLWMTTGKKPIKVLQY